MRRIRLPLTVIGVGGLALVIAVLAAPASPEDYPGRQAGPVAGAPQLKLSFCLRDIIEIERQVIIPKVPVGCEAIDCCPGCPGPGPLDWRVNVAGGPVTGLTLTFDNLSAASREGLSLEGEAEWLDERTLRLGPGETFIRGLAARPGERPPVAAPHIDMDRSGVEDKLVEADAAETRARLDDVDVSIEQLLGGIVVNEYLVSYRLWLCPRRPAASDTVDLDNNAINDNAVVLVDGRRSTCVNDQIFRGSDKVPVGNLRSNAACPSEVAVFTDNDAMQLFDSVTAWTDPAGDLMSADMTPDLLQAPVTVWLARANSQLPAQVHVAQANALYNTNNTGIGFAPNYQNVAGNNAAVATIGIPSCTLANIAALQGSAFYTANQLNVYYVNTATTGYNCVNDRNIIVIGTTPNPATLAHEFGHAFSLAHVNTAAGISVDYDVDGTADFANTNVMWGGGVGRTTFSEAQAFRMNLNPNSVLNGNNVRTGTTRTCADGTIGAACPWLGLDAVPN